MYYSGIIGDTSYLTKRFQKSLRHDLELKLIKRLQTPLLLDSDNINREGNISKMLGFDVVYLLDIKKRK